MRQQSPRVHHLLPQFYMRSFANARGQVRVVARDTGREFIAKTTKAFAERDYYTVASERAEDDHALIEGLHSRIEGIAAPIFEQLREDAFPLSAQDRSEFASFMAAQVTRGRNFREAVHNTGDRIARGMLRSAADAPSGYWEKKRAEWEASRKGPEPPPPLTGYERTMLREGHFDIVLSREFVVGMSFAHLDEMTVLLDAMDWRLVRFRQPCLFTSEHPVTYWRGPSSTRIITRVGPAIADEVRFALSPSRALLLTRSEANQTACDADENEHIYSGNEATARLLNWGTLTFPASKRLLLRPDVGIHPLPAVFPSV
jgi:hypothetical protein